MTRDEKGRFVKGHEAVGGGRKPKSHEEKVLEAVSRACSPADIQSIMEALIRKALNGNIQAAKVVLSYAVGMPVQKTDITSGGESLGVKVEYVNTPYPTAGIPSGTGGDSQEPEKV